MYGEIFFENFLASFIWWRAVGDLCFPSSVKNCWHSSSGLKNHDAHNWAACCLKAQTYHFERARGRSRQKEIQSYFFLYAMCTFSYRLHSLKKYSWCSLILLYFRASFYKSSFLKLLFKQAFKACLFIPYFPVSFQDSLAFPERFSKPFFPACFSS